MVVSDHSVKSAGEVDFAPVLEHVRRRQFVAALEGIDMATICPPCIIAVAAGALSLPGPLLPITFQHGMSGDLQ